MTAVITGASKGIGLAVAEKLLANYADLNLAICARDREEVQRVTEKLERSYPNAKVLGAPCDVSKEDDVKVFADEVFSHFGAVDLLVNNAGYGLFRPVEQIPAAEFEAILATNLRGVFLTTNAFLPGMMQKKSGTIVTISSLAGKNGFVGGAAYCASKFAVRGLMQSLFLDVRESNIRVTTIMPGSVDTDFFSTAHTDTLRSTKALSAEDVAECVLLATKLPITATVSEIELRPTNPKGI